MTEHYTTRYAQDIAQIFASFHELQKIHQGNYVMYYDGLTWEIFDCLLSTTVIAFPTKRLRDMNIAIKHLINDITNVRLIGTFNKPHYKLSQSCSLRNLKKVYPESYTYFLPYGKREEV